MTVNLIKPMLTLAVIAMTLSPVYAEHIDNSKVNIMTETQASETYDEVTNFSISSAHWTVRPKFTFPDTVLQKAQPGKSYSMMVKVEVDKQGNIVKRSIVQSSGNREIDIASINMLKDAKLKPFKKNGIAVRGLITLPVNYVVP